MTSLIAWIGKDSRGPASLYLAADSRLSWTDGSVWDRGRKLFAARSQPEMLGYCGEVVFPSQILGQVVAVIDSGAMDRCITCEDKAEIVCVLVNAALVDYSPRFRGPFSLLYCTRSGEGMSSTFACFEIAAPGGTVLANPPRVKLPDQSGVFAIHGSGSKVISNAASRWSETHPAGGRTSRATFGGFCDAVRSGDDPATGGSPQLVGLYRKGPAQTYGVVWEGGAFVFGMDVGSCRAPGIEWRNEQFERVDQRGLLVEGAQRQPRP